jgi:hypothetical protein
METSTGMNQSSQQNTDSETVALLRQIAALLTALTDGTKKLQVEVSGDVRTRT